MQSSAAGLPEFLCKILVAPVHLGMNVLQLEKWRSSQLAVQEKYKQYITVIDIENTHKIHTNGMICTKTCTMEFKSVLFGNYTRPSNLLESFDNVVLLSAKAGKPFTAMCMNTSSTSIFDGPAITARCSSEARYFQVLMHSHKEFSTQSYQMMAVRTLQDITNKVQGALPATKESASIASGSEEADLSRMIIMLYDEYFSVIASKMDVKPASANNSGVDAAEVWVKVSHMRYTEVNYKNTCAGVQKHIDATGAATAASSSPMYQILASMQLKWKGGRSCRDPSLFPNSSAAAQAAAAEQRQERERNVRPRLAE